MCQAHRKAVIAQMDAALDESRRGGPKVLCVSTQVIEAGVDISFGAVIRLTCRHGQRRADRRALQPEW